MSKKFVAHASISIKAGAAEVWNALTDPRLIRQYLFGTEAVSDWKPGSPVVYKGVWEGKAYEDKGRVLEAVKGERLKTTYWSSLSGIPDLPENYNTITYDLREKGGVTTLTLDQDNNPSRESADHSAANWNTVLATLKKLLEKPGA